MVFSYTGTITPGNYRLILTTGTITQSARYLVSGYGKTNLTFGAEVQEPLADGLRSTFAFASLKLGHSIITTATVTGTLYIYSSGAATPTVSNIPFF